MGKTIATDEFIEKSKEMIADYHNDNICNYKWECKRPDDVCYLFDDCISGDRKGIFLTNGKDGNYYKSLYKKQNDIFLAFCYKKFVSASTQCNNIGCIFDEKNLIDDAIGFLYYVENIEKLEKPIVNKVFHLKIGEFHTKIILEVEFYKTSYLIELNGETEDENTIFYMDVYGVFDIFEDKKNKKEEEQNRIIDAGVHNVYPFIIEN